MFVFSGGVRAGFQLLMCNACTNPVHNIVTFHPPALNLCYIETFISTGVTDLILKIKFPIQVMLHQCGPKISMALLRHPKQEVRLLGYPMRYGSTLDYLLLLLN